MSNPIKLGPRGFRSMMNIEETRYSDIEKQKSNPQVNVMQMSKTEAQAQLRNVVTPQDRRSLLKIGDASRIASYLNPTHKNIGRRIKTTEQLTRLAPEIEQASTILPSSIMSPNDMQDADFKFYFDDVDALKVDPDLMTAVQNYYDSFFNNKMKLNVECYKWLRDALYRSGAKAILLIPTKLHETIRDRSAEDVRKLRRDMGLENFQSYCANLDPDDNYLYSQTHTSWKAVFDGESTEHVASLTAPAMEALSVRVPDKFSSYGEADRSVHIGTNDQYMAAMETMIVNMRTKLEEGDYINISENPEIVRFNIERKIQSLRKADKALEKKFGLEPADLPEERILNLDQLDDGIITSNNRCTLIELPTESVIPIHIPGSPNQHLGYFILIDENGQPLVYSGEDEPGAIGIRNGSPVDQNTAEAFAAMYGTSGNVIRLSDNTRQSLDVQNVIFNHFLDRYIRTHLKNLIAGDDLELSQFNAIATTMFHRLLKNKKTTLVYVPPRLLHYLAFDYREDGTGKPKTEDMEFLLSLRTTLLMANVIGAMNDAIDHKKIEFDVGEAASLNLEQIMEIIRNMYISNVKIGGSFDPGEILGTMVMNSITVQPNAIEGLQNFKVDVTSNNSSSSKVDNEIIEHLTANMISFLDVPPSALNQLAEAEYSRSIATNNLFFAKKIGTYQAIVCNYISELIKVYTRFDSKFKQGLAQVIRNCSKARIKDKAPRKVVELAAKNPNQRSNVQQMIVDIMNNVTVKLPKTNIVVDRAQFDEIRQQISCIDELANRIFSEENLLQNDNHGVDGIKLMRAQWVRERIRDLVENIGNFHLAEWPNFDDSDPIDHLDYIQSAHNYEAAVAGQTNVLNNAADGGDSDDNDTGSDMGGGGDDDFSF